MLPDIARPLVTILGLVTAAAASAGPPAAPDPSPGPGHVLGEVAAAAGDPFSGPAWVPAEAVSENFQLQSTEVFGKTGRAAVEGRSMRLDHLSPGDRALFPPDLQQRLAKSKGLVPCDCPIVSVLASEAEPLPHSTISEIVASADDVLVGTVTDSALGFSFATAGTLLRVKIDRSLKKSATYAPLGTVYVFYPQAAFAIDDHLFCTQGWFGQFPPRRGDRVIVTPFGGWDAEDVPIVHAEWWELALYVSSTRVLSADILDPEAAREWAASEGLLPTPSGGLPRGDEKPTPLRRGRERGAD